MQEGTHVLALGRFESAHDKRSNARLGALKPMHCTSQGKAILSHLSDTQLELVLSGELTSFTEKTITDPAQLRAHLSIVRARGYAMDDEEIVLGTRCVGAAILDPDGKPVAAISVAGPTFRITPERAEQLGKELSDAAKRISAQLEPTLKVSAKASTDFCVWSTASAFAGASPRWGARAGTMYWADQLAPSIRAAGVDGEFISLHALSQSVSSFILTEAGFVCAVGADLVLGDGRGLHERIEGAPNLIVKALRTSPDNRVWAAAFDAEANMSRIGPVSRESGLEQVFELQGEVSDIAFAGELGIFAALGSRQSIYLLEPSTGRRRKFADLPKVAGAPGALAVDADLNPWIGLADGWSVVKLNENGEIERTIALPVPRPTGIAFGGENLSQIFITSARSGLSRESLTNAPLSGQLLSIEVGERGLPDHLGKI
ncbi:IclR family transcriptional regulator C-terminal domain-containing protein [Rhizobium leguminosarum]|nr:IclR family transcriptional regulator C-terminal domain-containing protein [Rhizobium leguminosarum]MDI5929723.1 IclR family transcriptional regulator C-terminal domain-containing protein [Rhizobium leguminosarum]